MPRISIVIRSCNEERLIGRLLDGISHQTVKDWEIILVDSGSTDRTLAIARRHPVHIEHIAPEEFSFGRALNRGCRVAGGEYLVFASAHVYPLLDTWLEALVAPFEADPRLALVYGRQRGPAGANYAEQQIFAHWFPAHSQPRQRHPFCNNANAAVRRARWVEQPYDEDLTGLEDVAWAKRAMARGYHIAYAADAQVIHEHHETPAQILHRYQREAIALRRISPQEQFREWDFVRLLALNVLSDCYHALREGVLSRNLGAIGRFRLMQFLGTYRGFHQHGAVDEALRQTFYYPRGLRRGGAAPRAGRGRKIAYRDDPEPGDAQP
jgi:glycosyltransferase involved in cell wall biosynthesis